MKSHLFLLILAIMFAACESQDIVTPFQAGQEVILSAYFPRYQTQQLPSKQYISGTDLHPLSDEGYIAVTWDKGDEILLSIDGESAIFTLQSGAGSQTATFRGKMPANGAEYTVQYPVEIPDITHQTYQENGFAKGMMSFAGSGTLDGFSLRAQHALLGLQLVGNQSLSEIVVTNPIDKKSYTLHCPNIKLCDTPTLFYIIVPAGEWAQGFRVDIYDHMKSKITSFDKTDAICFSTETTAMMPVRDCPIQFTINNVSFNMIRVRAGTFMMGALPTDNQAEDREKPAHQVTITKDFYIAETILTQALWTAVMGTSIQEEELHSSSAGGATGLGYGENFPMYCISYNDCQQFVNKLSEMIGQQFRLPTEAEWEYAARGGQFSKGFKYPGSNNHKEVAWNNVTSPSKMLHEVKQLKPNELGIYDMAGNTWEWIYDNERKYDSTPQKNPVGSTSETYATVRGGSAYYPSSYNRVSDRGRTFNKNYKVNRISFRFVLDADSRSLVSKK